MSHVYAAEFNLLIYIQCYWAEVTYLNLLIQVMCFFRCIDAGKLVERGASRSIAQPLPPLPSFPLLSSVLALTGPVQVKCLIVQKAP